MGWGLLGVCYYRLGSCALYCRLLYMTVLLPLSAFVIIARPLSNFLFILFRM